MSYLNMLSLVQFSNGEKGFVAKNEDNFDVAVLDIDGVDKPHRVGTYMVMRELGSYAEGDTEKLWDLIMSV